MKGYCCVVCLVNYRIAQKERYCGKAGSTTVSITSA
jgi:hypothetical protein